MDWFEQLRAALSAYYPPGSPPDVVGYLKGSANFRVWRSMVQGGHEQMVILGSVPPTDDEWAAAGVAQRRDVQTIRRDDLGTFIITYGGFVSRPWGKISTAATDDVLRNYAAVTISQFKASMPTRTARKAALVTAMNDAIGRIDHQMSITSGEHKAQRGIITGSQGNFTGFWGYWTNHLFNSDIPPQQIWTKCFSEIAHAIGAATVTLTFAAAAATIASAGAAGAAGVGAAEGASATTTVEGLTSLISKADTLLVRVDTTAPGGLTAPAAVAYEQTLAEVLEATEEALKMAL